MPKGDEGSGSAAFSAGSIGATKYAWTGETSWPGATKENSASRNLCSPGGSGTTASAGSAPAGTVTLRVFSSIVLPAQLRIVHFKSPANGRSHKLRSVATNWPLPSCSRRSATKVTSRRGEQSVSMRRSSNSKSPALRLLLQSMAKPVMRSGPCSLPSFSPPNQRQPSPGGAGVANSKTPSSPATGLASPMFRSKLIKCVAKLNRALCPDASPLKSQADLLGRARQRTVRHADPGPLALGKIEMPDLALSTGICASPRPDQPSPGSNFAATQLHTGTTGLPSTSRTSSISSAPSLRPLFSTSSAICDGGPWTMPSLAPPHWPLHSQHSNSISAHSPYGGSAVVFCSVWPVESV